MSDKTTVPVWTLSTTSQAQAPVPIGEAALTPERLAELRTALAAFADSPVVTLEAHPLTKRRGRSAGLPLDSLSPLAKELSRLVNQTPKSVPAMANVAESTEQLFRIVVPAKFAAQVGKGLVKPMTSKAVSGGIYGDLVGATGIAAKATFVPVTTVGAAGTAATAGTAGAVGATAGTVAAGTAMTVAAPLVLMAVALGASAHADQQRQKAIEHITELLEKLHDDKLEEERSELEGCRDAIDKATALLLDQGKVGASLGLDSAVHEISTATQAAHRRLKRWEAALDAFGDNRVDLAGLEASFDGISTEGGQFRAHLELAALAIALKRRVIILQGVEAGQSDPGNAFENFVRSLNADQQRVDELEDRIASVLFKLSSLELRSPQRLLDKVMTRGQVDDLLDAAYRLRALGDELASRSPMGDVVIEIEKHKDGTLLVLPARAA